jgi:hypothetical protein
MHPRGVTQLVGLLPVLTLLTVVYTRTVGAEFNEHEPVGDQLFWVGIHALLAYRVWRGGRLAWAVLLALIAVPPLTVGLLATAEPAGSFRYVGPLIGFSAAQAAILLLPRVRVHVQRSRGRRGVGTAPLTAHAQARPPSGQR